MQASARGTAIFVLVTAALAAAPAWSAPKDLPADSTPLTVVYRGTFDLSNTIVPQGVQHTFVYHVEWTFTWSGTWGELFTSGPSSNETSFQHAAITGSLHALWRQTPAGPDRKCMLRIVPEPGDFPDFVLAYDIAGGHLRVKNIESPVVRFGKYSHTSDPMCGGGPEIDMYDPPRSWNPLGERNVVLDLAGGTHRYDKSWKWHHIFSSDFRRNYTSAMHTSVQVTFANA